MTPSLYARYGHSSTWKTITYFRIKFSLVEMIHVFVKSRTGRKVARNSSSMDQGLLLVIGNSLQIWLGILSNRPVAYRFRIGSNNGDLELI